MKKEQISLWSASEYHYDLALGFIPSLHLYQHELKTNKFMLIVPGGGYAFVSPSEAEIVALEYYNKGYDVAVLTYTTNLISSTPLLDQPINDLARSLRYIRSIGYDKVVACGFSAGGHLVGSIAVHHQNIKDCNEKYQDYSCKPDAVVLCYPVISSAQYAHEGSFQNLVADNSELREFYSLEKQVSVATPPVFIWHTVNDETVAVENSLLFINALQKNNVSYCAHIFSQGKHGLSLANQDYADGKFGDPYTLKQTKLVIDAIKNGDISFPEEHKELLFKKFSENKQLNTINKEVSIWPLLVANWLDKVLVD